MAAVSLPQGVLRVGRKLQCGASNHSHGRLAQIPAPQNVASTSCLSTPLCVATSAECFRGSRFPGAVIWNRDALRGWSICLQDDMTTLLMDLTTVPMFADRLNDRAARKVARDFHVVVRTSSRTRRRRMRTAIFRADPHTPDLSDLHRAAFQPLYSAPGSRSRQRPRAVRQLP